MPSHPSTLSSHPSTSPSMLDDTDPAAAGSRVAPNLSAAVALSPSAPSTSPSTAPSTTHPLGHAAEAAPVMMKLSGGSGGVSAFNELRNSDMHEIQSAVHDHQSLLHCMWAFVFSSLFLSLFISLFFFFSFFTLHTHIHQAFCIVCGFFFWFLFSLSFFLPLFSFTSNTHSHQPSVSAALYVFFLFLNARTYAYMHSHKTTTQKTIAKSARTLSHTHDLYSHILLICLHTLMTYILISYSHACTHS